jgi:glycosyltransferase involved in cell wall biosynthesis
LVATGAPVVALHGSDAEAEILAREIPGIMMRRWSRAAVRDHVGPGTWYLATQLMLHPIPLDPIPRVITETRLPVAAVMYDVIPYRYPALYLDEPNAAHQAVLRAALARTVDTFLAISAFAADTAAEVLGVPRSCFGVIGAGVDPVFRPATADPRARAARALPHGVDEYVVAVAGTDDRKNTDGLIRAWAQLPAAARERHNLVVVAAHTPAVLAQWEACAASAGVTDTIVFTGGLSDGDLVAVLQGAALSVMPSLEEGFGLPVLEAAACGTPVISSDVSSLPEVLAEPAACFDPHDERAMAAAIELALVDDAHRALLLDAGRRAVERWTWRHAAEATLDILATTGPRWRQRITTPRRRIALAGPVDDGPETITDTMLEALRSVRPGTSWLTLVDSSRSTRPSAAGPDRWPIRAVGRFVKPWDVDAILAVFGDPERSAATAHVAATVPCHLWLREEWTRSDRFADWLASPDDSPLRCGRSVLVPSAATAELLRAAVPRCPVLVVPGAPADTVAAVAQWLDRIEGAEPPPPGHR